MSQSIDNEPASTIRRSRRLQNLPPTEPQAVPGTSGQSFAKEERVTESQVEQSTQVELCLQSCHFLTTFSQNAHRCKKNYKHLCFAIVIAFRQNTLHWLA